jgi:hypothetical protein
MANWNIIIRMKVNNREELALRGQPLLYSLPKTCTEKQQEKSW